MLRRLASAFLIAPIVGMGVGDLVSAFLFHSGFGLLTFAGALVAYPVVFVFGLPTYLLLSWKRWLSLPSIVVAGMLLGALAWAIVLWPLAGPSYERHAIGYGFFAFVSGVMGSLVFWSIAMTAEAKPHETTEA